MSKDPKILTARAEEYGRVHWVGVVVVGFDGRDYKTWCDHKHRSYDRAEDCAARLELDVLKSFRSLMSDNH